jgi:hypothetical protein
MLQVFLKDSSDTSVLVENAIWNCLFRMLAIMDFSKVFDKVCHNLLIHKLHHYGIRDKTNRWIQSFLRDRNQSVVVEGETYGNTYIFFSCYLL